VDVDVDVDVVIERDEGRVVERSKGTRPVIRIDETPGLVHAWCLEQSQPVAAQVGAWLDEILSILDQDEVLRDVQKR